MLSLGLSRRIPRPAALCLFFAFTAFPSAQSFGETFRVPEDARTIGQAIDMSVRDGTTTTDVIEVATDTYVDNLTISTSVTIRAKDGAKVVLRAASNEPIITIGGTSAAVTIDGLILITSGTGVKIEGSPSVILRNLVITLASIAIDCSGNTITGSTIAQVTFFNVANGINCPTSNIVIRNNIFSNVSVMPITPFSTVVGFTQPVGNLFWNVPPNSGERGDEVDPNPPDDLDPEFVEVTKGPEENDFHLRSGSAAKGAGEGGADVGAYGGLGASTVPFPPEKPTVTCGDPDATSCKVSWAQNLDYLVTGYLVLSSAPSAPNPDYAQTNPVDNAPTLCVGSPPVCSFTRSSLVDTGTTPAQPSAPTAGFGDSRVQLTWPAVADATAYEVYVGTAPNSGTLALTVSSNSALVEGLTNGTLHYFAIRAVNQPKFYAAVKSVDESPVLATSPASEISEADAVTYGTAGIGPLSAEVTSTPQPLVAFPPLNDTGGCFIATAAYGSPLAPQVDVLRMFREHYLRPHVPGRILIRVYETVSPPVAEMIRSSDPLRLVVRVMLWPVVGLAWMTVHGSWWGLLILGAATMGGLVLVRRRGAVRA